MSPDLDGTTPRLVRRSRVPNAARLLRLPQAGDFPVLWAGNTVGLFGDELSRVALPTLAILVLGARPLEVGLLAAAAWICWPFLAVLAGVWIDRASRVRVMILGNLIRALVFGLVVLLAIAGQLNLPMLIGAAILVGAAGVFFELGNTAYVAEALPSSEIPLANSRLEASRSIAQVAGPGIAGALISAVGSVFVVAHSVAAFGASALLLRRIRLPPRTVTSHTRRFRAELVEGFTALRGEPVLLRLTLTAAISNLGLVAAHTVLLLHLYRALALDPAIAGVLLAFPGIGALIGVAAANRLTARVGVGWVLVVATVLESAFLAGIALAPGFAAVPLVAASLALSAFWGVIWNIVAISVRQVALPRHLQARVAAIRGAIGYSVIPVGGVAGGVMSELLSPALGVGSFAGTILIGASVGVVSGLPLLAPSVAPFRRWRFGQRWPY